MTNDKMTNDELKPNDETKELNSLVRPFVIRASAFLRHSAFVLRHSYS
jgi:hypothetical protein